MGLKALLVGINAYEKAPLRGCVNDVNRMRELLQQQYHLGAEQMRVLLDAVATRAAILEGLRWLGEPDGTDGTDSPPIRLFHFSGHGIQVADQDGDEPDGMDEALAQYDYQTTGVLRDDELRQAYDHYLAHTHLLLTMDCCHSGDIQFVPDVLFRFLPPDAEEYSKIQVAKHRYRLRQAEASQSGAAAPALTLAEKKQRRYNEQNDFAVLISACRSDQTAADARFGDTFNGALTYYLANVVEETGGNLSYNALLERVRTAIEQSKFLQVPQLMGKDENRGRSFLS